MSSDIYTDFDSDNFVGFSYIPSFHRHYPYDDFRLRAVSEGGFPPEELRLPQLHDPPPQFQEPLVFSSEGFVQRSYSSNCMGTGGGGGKGLIRRLYSMGDPQRRVERYNAEEMKERIRKYREKRNLRNFNKTIKYACRKTLADSRPRIRGRFA